MINLALGQYNCENDEEITSVASFKIQVQDEEKPLFCLGTMLFKDEEKEPSVGRLIIFTAYTPINSTKTSSLELSLVASTKVEGCVYALKIVDGKIVAAVNSSVGSGPSYLASHALIPFSITSYPDFDVSSGGHHGRRNSSNVQPKETCRMEPQLHSDKSGSIQQPCRRRGSDQLRFHAEGGKQQASL